MRLMMTASAMGQAGEFAQSFASGMEEVGQSLAVRFALADPAR